MRQQEAFPFKMPTSLSVNAPGGVAARITVLGGKNGTVIAPLAARPAPGPAPQPDQRGLHHEEADAEADASTDEHRERRDFPNEGAVTHRAISMGQSQYGHVFL